MLVASRGLAPTYLALGHLAFPCLVIRRRPRRGCLAATLAYNILVLVVSVRSTANIIVWSVGTSAPAPHESDLNSEVTAIVGRPCLASPR